MYHYESTTRGPSVSLGICVAQDRIFADTINRVIEHASLHGISSPRTASGKREAAVDSMLQLSTNIMHAEYRIKFKSEICLATQLFYAI